MVNWEQTDETFLNDLADKLDQAIIDKWTPNPWSDSTMSYLHPPIFAFDVMRLRGIIQNGIKREKQH